jgi:hypothetical protein
MCVQLSSPTFDLVKKLPIGGEVKFRSLGPRQVKGKGDMSTFLLEYGDWKRALDEWNTRQQNQAERASTLNEEEEEIWIEKQVATVHDEGTSAKGSVDFVSLKEPSFRTNANGFSSSTGGDSYFYSSPEFVLPTPLTPVNSSGRDFSSGSACSQEEIPPDPGALATPRQSRNGIRMRFGCFRSSGL